MTGTVDPMVKVAAQRCRVRLPVGGAWPVVGHVVYVVRHRRAEGGRR